MDINEETRKRIIAAAEQLYSESGGERFPSVDHVRRTARADMNTTSIVMKEWRRQQGAAPAPIAVEVPARVHEFFQGALVEAWREALGMANESLKAAQQAWEVERAEAEELRHEMATAYETQAQELVDVSAMASQGVQEIGELEKVLAGHCEHIKELESDLANQRRDNLMDKETIDRLETENKRIEQLLSANAAELAATRASAEGQKLAADERRAEALAEMKRLVEELSQARKALAQAEGQVSRLEDETRRKEEAKAEVRRLGVELERERNNAALARERAAGLAGQLDAVTEQNKSLLSIVQPQKNRKKPGGESQSEPEK